MDLLVTNGPTTLAFSKANSRVCFFRTGGRSRTLKAEQHALRGRSEAGYEYKQEAERCCERTGGVGNENLLRHYAWVLEVTPVSLRLCSLRVTAEKQASDESGTFSDSLVI